MKEFDNENNFDGRGENDIPREDINTAAEEVSFDGRTESSQQPRTEFSGNPYTQRAGYNGAYSYGSDVGRAPEDRPGYSYNYANPHGGAEPVNRAPSDIHYGEPRSRDTYQSRYTSPQSDGYKNSYVPSYGTPRYSGGNISYTPYPEKAQKKKEKKSASMSALVIICVIAVILSGMSGFIGVKLASADLNNDVSVGADSGESSRPADGNENSIVIYRGVENVTSSVEKNDGEALSYEEVAALVKDSVVEITTEYNMQSMWYQYITEGAGSGVIISEDGHIITNNHVISDEDSGKIADSIKVRLTDGSEYTATVVGTDAIADIAILKIEAENLTVAICGDSDDLALGEELIIVGNPLGELGGTVTNGIVSATERTIQVNSVEMTLIQTNAAVNPGNSGGGMFNMAGQLVGIVNAKSSGTGIEGLGFAIPVNEALSVTEQLLEYGYVRGRTTIGVTFYDVENSYFQSYYSLKDGVYVSELENGYNDDVLKVGDRVIAVNGTEVASEADITAIVMASEVGDKLVFQLYRDRKLIEVEVTCYESVPDDAKDDVRFGK